MKTPWNKEALSLLPTLTLGQCCDLKIEANKTRVWLCRVSNGVTVERFNTVTGQWYTSEGGCRD